MFEKRDPEELSRELLVVFADKLPEVEAGEICDNLATLVAWLWMCSESGLESTLYRGKEKTLVLEMKGGKIVCGGKPKNDLEDQIRRRNNQGRDNWPN